MNKERSNLQIIAGPCGLENRHTAEQTIFEAERSGIDTIRMNLWKPRTRSSYDGLGETGLPLVREAAESGLNVAMEVMLPEHVEQLKQEVLAYANDVALLLWIGSRNQNHLVQRQIAAAVKGIDHIKLMIKNQPWREMKHWAGIVSHVQDEGLPNEQLLLCHRGFAPWDKERSELRNIPDLPMAEQIKSELQLPMILDPSHMGGAVHLVKQLARDFIDCDWVDGLMIEVHPCPEQALTDGQQQLTWEELRSLLAVRSKQRVPRSRAKPVKERAVV